MAKIAIVTDSNSGITQGAAAELGVHVVPMPFFINGTLHYEDIDLTQEQFYQLLSEDADVSTSQPSPGDLMERWDSLLKEYDSIVYNPMSSALSTAGEMAAGLAADYDGRVSVVNNRRISITQRHAVVDAKALADRGYSAEDIKVILERDGLTASIYLMVDTLKYLKKGGRVTPAAAMIGTVLNIKPVLKIYGGKLDAHAKVRGVRQAKKVMLDSIRKDLEGRFAAEAAAGQMVIQAAYSNLNKDEVQAWEEEIREAFPGYPVRSDPLSLSVACHTGPGVIAIACSRTSLG